KHVADVSGLQARQGLDVQFRQALLTAPTHYTSLKRIRRIGVRGGEPGELRAVPEPPDHFLGAGTPAFQLLGGRLLGYPDQNVLDVVFGPGTRAGNPRAAGKPACPARKSTRLNSSHRTISYAV